MIKQAIFMLGEEKYGMDIMDINIIEKAITVEPNAVLTGNFKGIINLRDEKIPVYSLRRRIGLEDIAYDEDTRFILSSLDGLTVAYEVDRVVEIVQLEENKLLAVPEISIGKGNQFMKNVINYNGDLIIILDPDKILTEQEQAAVEKVIKDKIKTEDSKNN